MYTLISNVKSIGTTNKSLLINCLSFIFKENSAPNRTHFPVKAAKNAPRVLGSQHPEVKLTVMGLSSDLIVSVALPIPLIVRLILIGLAGRIHHMVRLCTCE